MPNPFRSSTTIPFDVPAEGARIRLDVLDIGGRCVATLVDEFRSGGRKSAMWTGVDSKGEAAAPGIYFYRFQGAGSVETRRLVLLR